MLWGALEPKVLYTVLAHDTWDVLLFLQPRPDFVQVQPPLRLTERLFDLRRQRRVDALNLDIRLGSRRQLLLNFSCFAFVFGSSSRGWALPNAFVFGS